MIGLKFSTFSAGNFFSNGTMFADFHLVGKKQELSDKLNRSVRDGDNSSAHSTKILAGILSGP